MEDREVWTIEDLISELDGAGIVITDWDEIECQLERFGFTRDDLLYIER